MAKDICQSEDLARTEATLEEATSEETSFEEIILEEAVEKDDCIQVVNDQVSFYCLVRTRGKKCPYSPFNHRFHLNDHLRITHLMTLSKIKSGRRLQLQVRTMQKKFQG